jgi:hypothetical protein
MLPLSKFKIISASIWSILMVVGMFVELPITEGQYLSIVAAVSGILVIFGVVVEDKSLRKLRKKGLY